MDMTAAVPAERISDEYISLKGGVIMDLRVIDLFVSGCCLNGNLL